MLDNVQNTLYFLLKSVMRTKIEVLKSIDEAYGSLDNFIRLRYYGQNCENYHVYKQRFRQKPILKPLEVVLINIIISTKSLGAFKIDTQRLEDIIKQNPSLFYKP